MKKIYTKKKSKKYKSSKKSLPKKSLHTNTTINILSYNVSWESMTGNDSNWALCSNNTNSENPKHYSVCVNNIANVINESLDILDFITLQESANYEKLIEQSPILQKMKYETHKSGLENMVTFWLPKYKLLYNIKGEFEKGRPWLATVFTLTHGISHSRICLINLHMGHYDYNEEYLHLEKMIFQVKEQIIKNEIEKKGAINMNMNNVRYIVSGDFNYDIKEFGSKNKTVSKINNIISINGIHFYYHQKHILTCCIKRRRHYDHVLDSLHKPIDITIPKVSFMASDHKPIIIKLLNY